MKKQQEEKRTEQTDLSSQVSKEKGKINDSDQYVLREVDRHVIAQVFSRKVFEQQPRQEEIDAIAPAIEHGHYKGRTDEDQRDVREPFHIAGDDVIRGLVNGDHKQGYESKKGKRSAELIPRHRSRRKINGTRSQIRT